MPVRCGRDVMRDWSWPYFFFIALPDSPLPWSLLWCHTLFVIINWSITVRGQSSDQRKKRGGFSGCAIRLNASLPHGNITVIQYRTLLVVGAASVLPLLLLGS